MHTIQGVKAQFELVSKNAALEVLLPTTNDLDINSAIEENTLDDLLKSYTRRNIYFDESTSLFILLKTNAARDDVRKLLPHLDLTISAHAADSGVRESGNVSTAKYDLISKTVSASDAANVIIKGTETVFVWSIDLHLSRPRARFHRPAIYFMVNLSVNTKSLKALKSGEEDILKSFEPVPSNVLEPLHYDPSFVASNIKLSEDRVVKVAPSSRKIDHITPIRGSSKRMHPAFPALFTRIRYSALPDSIIASLHVDTSMGLQGVVKVNGVQLDIANAVVTPLFSLEPQPVTKPGEELVFLYKVRSKLSGSALSVLSVDVKATVSAEDGSISPVHVSWQAQIDLSQTSPKPIYRWSRSTNPPSHKSRLSSQIVNYQPVTSDDTPERTTKSAETGVILTFTIPSTVKRMREFKIGIHCVNRSDQPRRFSLMAVPRTKAKSRKIGLPVLPEIEADPPTRSLSMPFGSLDKSAEVQDLDPDVKIGPLSVGACFETSMRFRPVTTGVLDIGTMRVMDLDSKETVDVKELSQIICVDNNDAG